MRPKILASIFLTLILGSAITHAQVSTPPIPVEEIIKKFSEKEKDFKLARANYTYREVVSVEELTADDRSVEDSSRPARLVSTVKANVPQRSFTLHNRRW